MSPAMIALTEMDGRLFQAVVLRRRPTMDLLMRWVTRLGNWYVIAPITLVLALMPELRDAGVQAFWSLGVSHGLVQLLKRSIARERPSLPIGRCFLVEPEDRFSFPSGHATAGLSVALPLFWALGGPVAFLVLAAGLAIGASRCYLGVHYPGDVVAGWFLGTFTVLALAAI